MKLTSIANKPPKPVFNQVRETPAVVKALADEASNVGISATEALRQIIAGYLANPFAFAPGISKGRKSAVWDNIKSDPATIEAFTRLATEHGVSVAEGIRQCVRGYLRQHGRLPKKLDA